MELNANINTFQGGLDLDTDVSLLGKNTMRYAENIRLVTNTDGTSAAIQNSDYIQKYDFSKQLFINNFGNILGVVGTKYCECEDTNCIQKECAVVFTREWEIEVPGEHDKDYINCVYRITFDDTTPESIKLILKGNFGWSSNLSLVANFENCNVSKVYIADGKNTLRVINIAKDYDEITNVSTLDMIPESSLNRFEISKLVTGSLTSGKYQYAYQLFSKNGAASAISPLSVIIPISAEISSINSNSTRGSQMNTTTTKGVELTTEFENNNFNHIRVYRIFYQETGQIPIYILSETSIEESYDTQKFTFIDFGNEPISSITMDEFNQLATMYNFQAQVIESKDNILFAANIQENTWDPVYDARAYRADENGNVVLKSTINDDVLTFSIDAIPDEIDERHDCLNPSNLELYNEASFKYVYKNKDGVFGGSGKNVSYEFVFKEVILSDKEVSDNYPAYDLSLNVSAVSSKDILLDQNGNKISESTDTVQSTFNYADAWFCSDYTGYQRDEIYRFGIVLYNNKGLASPVHWIADIRMPNATMGTPDSILYPFHLAKNSVILNKTVELLGYAMGVRFHVNNLPEDVVKYEIVRCPRNTSDRTVVSQVVASSLIVEEDTWIEGNTSVADKGIYPQFLLNMSDRLGVSRPWGNVNQTKAYSFDTKQRYLELISPEICVSQENSQLLMKDGQLCHIYNIYTKQNNSVSIGIINDYGVAEQLVTGYGICVKPNNVNTLDGEIDSLENYRYYYWYTLNSEPYIFTGDDDAAAGSTALFKYYHHEPQASIKPPYLIEQIVSPAVQQEVAELLDLTKNSTAIGDSLYVNLSLETAERYGRHGVNLVVKTVDDIEYLPYSTSYSDESQLMNCAGVFNVKKSTHFMTDTYLNRTNDVYISCSACKNRGETTVDCFGGDTYITVLDYLNTAFHQRSNDYTTKEGYRLHTQCYIPFESTVNTNLFSNKQYHYELDGIDNGPNLIQTNPVSYGSYVQTDPQYTYNTIYSQNANVLNFIVKAIYSEDDQQFNNRIVHSELKTNNEIQDSWLTFKVANYLEVDNKYGQITNLKNFANKLFYFQENAVGVASVNERSLIVDNISELTLGTGTVLSRYDYIGVTNGDSIINDKSIVTSATNLYWYDYDRNTLCVIGDKIVELSKLKNVQSYYNENYKAYRKEPVSAYNKKYDEVWFTVLNKTLIYNERLNVFTSFNTHWYKYALTFNDKLVTVGDDCFYKHNEQVDENYEVEPLISKLDIVVNDNFMYTKVFDNVMFYADFEGNINNISYVLFKTKSQTSEEINSSNIECREDTYRFAIPRELTTNTDSMSYSGRMRGKCLYEFFTFDCNDNKTFKIPYIKTTYRQSRL